MRVLVVIIIALSAGASFAQRRPATEAEAQSYITSAFVSQADPGVMSARVALGPELERALGLPQGTDRAKVYEAVIPLTGEQRLVVRRATPAETADYGQRRGLQPASAHPLFIVEGGQVKLLLQYDLQALNILFVGQLGLPDPDPRPVAKAEPPAAPAPKKPAVVNVAWSAEFGYNSADLTPELRAKLDSEIIPKLIEAREVRYLHLYGHTDRLGRSDYNQKLSEKRAEAVRAYLISKGVNADKIEVFGYGQTLPVKSCTEQKKRTELIECLAPNRRIVVEIQAAP